MGVCSSPALGHRSAPAAMVRGGWPPDVGEKAIPVGDLAGARLGELQGRSAQVVLALSRPDDGGGELSAAEGLRRRRSYVFRRVYGSGKSSSTRMSY